MFRRLVSPAGVLALGLAVALAAGTPALAQYRGGGYGVPVQVGVGGGGVRIGVGFGAVPYGYGPRIGFGYVGGNVAIAVGVGGLGRGYYGYPAPRVPVPYYAPSYGIAPTYPPSVAQPPASYAPPAAQMLPPPSPMSLGTARITVQVPANARIWVDDMPTSQTGPMREYVTPPALEAGKTYKYTFRAQWEVNGQTVTREQTVELQAGSQIAVDFNAEVKITGP